MQLVHTEEISGSGLEPEPSAMSTAGAVQYDQCAGGGQGFVYGPCLPLPHTKVAGSGHGTDTKCMTGIPLEPARRQDQMEALNRMIGSGAFKNIESVESVESMIRSQIGCVGGPRW